MTRKNNIALWEFHNGICKPGQIQGPIQTLYARSKWVARIEMTVNGTDFKAWLDGNLRSNTRWGLNLRRQTALRIQVIASRNSVLRLPVAGRLRLWAKTNGTSISRITS